MCTFIVSSLKVFNTFKLFVGDMAKRKTLYAAEHAIDLTYYATQPSPVEITSPGDVNT